MAIEAAAALSGMSLGEAMDLAEIDRKNPPPEEGFRLLYNPDAPAAASSTQAKEADMARGRKARAPEDDHDTEAGEGGGINGEYQRPNAELAFKIYDQQIKPKAAHLATIKGDMSEPYQQIKDQAHFPRKVLNFITSLEDMEDAKRDHTLIALAEGLKFREMFLPRDLVTMAQGDDGGTVVPFGAAQERSLLVDEPEDEAEEFEEASEAELAAQAGRTTRRGGGRKASVSGSIGAGLN